MELIKCWAAEPNSVERLNHQSSAAILFERVSCLVYRGKDGGYKKPSAGVYDKIVFEASAETPEEVFSRVKEYGIGREQAGHIYKLIRLIADIVCPMMACITEQAFAGEYAYAIDYVIKADGDLPEPRTSGLFPTNYNDFNYWEGVADKVAKYIR